jgi:hypothetical protein
VQRADKQAKVVFSGLFFFGSFLLEWQKKGTLIKKEGDLLRHPLQLIN